MAQTIKERIYKFDNVKLLAILLVVTGHFIDLFTDHSEFFQSGFIFIYSFHMPLFIFISGLFIKQFHKGDKFPIHKLGYYLIVGFALKLLQYGEKLLLGENPKLDLLGGQAVEWFMFVLAFYLLTAFLVKRVKWYIILPITLILGLGVGFFNDISDDYYLSRYLVFMPFFFAGYYLTPEKLMALTKPIAVKITSITLLIVYFVMCFRQRTLIYPLRRLFTGRNPYSVVKIEGCTFYHRLLCYLIAAILIIAVISCIPNRKIPVLSHMGENTLGVYFWHKPVMFLLSHFGFFSLIKGAGDPMWKLIVLFSAVALTLLLSIDVFSYPFKALSKGLSKLGRKGNYILTISIVGLAILFGVLMIHTNF